MRKKATFHHTELYPPRQFQGIPFSLFIRFFKNEVTGSEAPDDSTPRDLPTSFLQVIFSELEIIPEELPMRPLELSQNPACFKTSQSQLNSSFLIGEGKTTENHFDCPEWL